MWQRGVSALRAEPALAAFVALAAIAYLVFSLVRYDQFSHSGFDLGIFDEVVWHYSRFEAPASSVKNLDYIWGDHFSPILALLAPLYWIWEDARVLLIAQALLLAAAAVPIFLYVRAKLSRLAAYLFALSYLAFWGVQSALSFDFHELAFAPLLIALILLAIERRRWGAYFPLLIALLCVKEDLSILVVFVGIYVMTFGALRQGLITIALGVAWYVLVVKLLIPHYNPASDYAYWTYKQFGEGPLPALAHAVTHPDLVVRTLFDSAAKTHTLTYMFVPFLGLMLCSRTVILLAPLIAERFLSTNELLWNTSGHYTLAVAALLIIGAADGLSNLRRLAPPPVRRLLVIGVAGIVLVLNVAFTRSFTLSFTHLTHSDFYSTPAWVKDAKRALAAVPADVSVAAQDNVIPRLVHRDVAAEISPGTGTTDYVVALVVDNGIGTVINGGFGSISRYVNARLASHVPVAYVNGWLVLRAKSLPPVARAPQLVPMSAADAARIEAARSGWMTAFDEYVQALGSCLAKPDPRACSVSLGGEFRRRQLRLDRELVRVRSSLKTGCLAQSLLAAAAARVVSETLEATRKAAAQGAPAELIKRSTVLQETLAKDAPGYVTRFAALCSPSSPPGKAVS